VIDPDRLAADGFVVSELLDDDLLEALRDRYEQFALDPGHPFFASSNHLDGPDARRVDLELRSLLEPVVAAALPGHRSFLASFLTKGARTGARIDLHQDLTYTDERRARTILVWIPLCDVDSSNGALEVVPGSHLWSCGSRPGGADRSPTAGLQDELTGLVASVPLRAGTAVVYDAAIVHGSPPNRSDHPRAAVGLAVVPADADLVHVHVDADGSPNAYLVDDAYYTEQGLANEPRGYPEIGLWAPPVEEAELRRGIAARGTTSSASRTAGSGEGADSDPVAVPSGAKRSAAPRRLVRPRLRAAHGRALLPPAAPALVDPEADRRLRRDGFTRVPLLDDATVAELHDLYGTLHGWSGAGFEPDLANTDTHYRRESSARIARLLDERVGSLFVDHLPYLRTFLCKWPGDDSALNLHRDWMYVDERSGEHSYVVWIPLVDVTTENGPLQVLRHSHRVDPMLRGTHLNASWVEDETYVRPRLLTIPARAGDAVILDNQLVHCSTPNRSSVPRPVTAVGMRRRGAPLVYFRRIDDQTAARYDVDEEFFLTYTPQRLMDSAPELPVVETVPIGDAHLDGAEVVSRLRSSRLTWLDDANRWAAELRERVARERVG
jgi:ectoine hydroxylase-related dioxygenase (phytanoyl-CoA dioxygenase family)